MFTISIAPTPLAPLPVQAAGRRQPTACDVPELAYLRRAGGSGAAVSRLAAESGCGPRSAAGAFREAAGFRGAVCGQAVAAV